MAVVECGDGDGGCGVLCGGRQELKLVNGGILHRAVNDTACELLTGGGKVAKRAKVAKK